MSYNREKLLKVNSMASSIVQEMVRDGTSYNPENLKYAVENLSRVVVDLTNIELGKDGDTSTTLKATVTKTKLAYNSIVDYERQAVPK